MPLFALLVFLSGPAMPCFSSRSKLPHAPGNFPPAARSGSIPEEGPACWVPGTLLGAQSSSSPPSPLGQVALRGDARPQDTGELLSLSSTKSLPNIPTRILAQFSPKLRILNKELQLCQVFPATSSPFTPGGSSKPLMNTLSLKVFSRGCSGAPSPHPGMSPAIPGRPCQAFPSPGSWS